MKNTYINSFLKFGSIFFIAFVFACGQDNPNDKNTTEPKQTTEVESTESRSIYQVPLEWHTHLGDTISLKSLEGKIPVIAMVFTHCGYACPRMVADLKNIKQQLPKAAEDEVVFVLISFDTERDNPERLRQYAQEMQLKDNWLLLHGNEEDVRTLSMLLDVQYKKQESGDFAHSNKIILLNKKGEIVEEVDGLGSDPSPILNKIGELS